MTLQSLQLSSPIEYYNRRRRWVGSRPYWLCQLAGWGGLSVLLLGPMPFRVGVSASAAAAVATFVVSGALLTHFLRLALIGILQQPVTWLRLAAKVLPLVLVVAVLHALAQTAAARTVLPHDVVFLTSMPAHDPLLFTLLDMGSLSLGLFTTWTGAYLGLRIYRRFQEARIERLQMTTHLQEAAWQTLRAQLNPHLLFNSLNSIRALIHRDNPAPREAIIHLSDLLRTTLALKDDALVPLERELETVDSYLALERLRFEQRLQVIRTVDTDALNWLVPPFMVQILVENAVKYGVAPYESGGPVGLTARVEGGKLVVEVANNGEIGRVKSHHSTGLGLNNVRSRLALAFGAEAQLTLTNLEGNKVLARAVIPRARQPEAQRPVYP
ncbi:hypothetical protein DB347_23115 [Opitutaceae bacterium EW11]|nr:hypothetical protein DB347_23115 [Opitutaceae bacterium EW11]